LIINLNDNWQVQYVSNFYLSSTLGYLNIVRKFHQVLDLEIMGFNP
jgi:hypothetical protein